MLDTQTFIFGLTADFVQENHVKTRIPFVHNKACFSDNPAPTGRIF